MAKRGKRVVFHGAFSSAKKAKAKARRVGGYCRRMIVGGHRRTLVLTEKKR